MSETLKDVPTVKPDLFARIAELVPQMEGWCSVPKAFTLAGAVLALRPACIVELGVWGGRSVIPMAMALKECGSGIALAIDPWSAEASKIGMIGDNLSFWNNQGNHEMAYRSYLSWMNKMGVRDCIRTIRAKSDDTEPPPIIDIGHFDGNHSDQAIRDVQRFAPHIRVGGLCFADDIGWDGGGVARSVDLLHEMGFIDLYRMDTGLMLQRIR